MDNEIKGKNGNGSSSNNNLILNAVKISYADFYDLTNLINEEMAIFPGDPEVQFYKHNTIQSDGFNVTRIKLGSHTGTHVDAQSHFLSNGNTVDNEPFDKFIGEAVIVDISQKRSIGEGITYEDLDSYAKEVKRNDILLIYTATSDYQLEKIGNGNNNFNIISNNNNNNNNKFTYLEDSAAEWLVSHGLKCVGIDTFSIEKYGSKDGSVHKKLLSNQIGIIENINSNLKNFVNRRMFLVCLPLLLKGLDGAPSRALLFDILQYDMERSKVS